MEWVEPNRIRRDEWARPLATVSVEGIGGSGAVRVPRGSWPIYLTSLLSVVIVLLSVAFFAWRDRQQAFRDAEILSAGLAQILAEHAGRLFETGDILLKQMIASIDPNDPSASVNRANWEKLVALSGSAPFIRSIAVGDADGDTLLTSHDYPAPLLNAAGRPYFRFHRNDDGSRVHIGTFVDSRTTDEELILLSRSIRAPDRTFRGFATITLAPGYLSRFYRHLDFGYSPIVEIFTTDMRRIFRQPSVDPARPVGAAPIFGTSLETDGAGIVHAVSPLDGVERINAYDRIRGYDAYLNVGLPLDDVWARWHQRLWAYSYYGLAALLTIMALTFLAIERARRERAAERALADADEQLERRIAARTAALRAANLRLQTALADKEVLFKEVHHRVKNSLQLISSLLGLQAGSVAQPEVREQLSEARNRVMTVTQMHQQLYQTDTIDTVEFGQFLESLCADLRQSLASNGRACDIRVTAERQELRTDEAVNLGLAVNELVTNAFKYAYPGNADATIEVSFEAGDRGAFRLDVADRGIGLPADFEPMASATLGMRLVVALTRHLDADLAVVRQEPGTRFSIVRAASE